MSVKVAATAAAKALAAYLDVSGAPVATQATKHRAYMKAYEKLLREMNAQSLSEANERALQAEAQKYRKVMRGPGCTS